MIGMAGSSILEHNLPLTVASWQVLQILQFIYSRISSSRILNLYVKIYSSGGRFSDLFNGDLPSSPVGILCSPGLIHNIGPSLLLFLLISSCSMLLSPHGRVYGNGEQYKSTYQDQTRPTSDRIGISSSISRTSGKNPPLSSLAVPTRLRFSR